MSRKLPIVGDRINCDPNRELGDHPDRWDNINRKSATVIAIIEGRPEKVIVLKSWSPRRQKWLYWAEPETWWQIDTRWEIGQLKRQRGWYYGGRKAAPVSRETSRLTKDQ